MYVTRPFSEQLKAEKQAVIRDFTVDGKCSDCGSCCGNYLPLSAKEIKLIKRYVRKKGIKEQRHIFPLAEQPMLDFSCPFRSDTEKKCVIYDVRPAICRDFQCDRPRQHILADKEMYHRKYPVCDMRKEFFGGRGSDGR